MPSTAQSIHKGMGWGLGNTAEQRRKEKGLRMAVLQTGKESSLLNCEMKQWL